MSYTPRYDRGDWNTICDVCGRQFKASQLRQRWDGLKVDNDCWEPRHPQDFVKGVADYQAPPFTRPEQQNQFIPLVYNGYALLDPMGLTNSTSLITRIVPNPALYPKTVDGKDNLINTYTLG